MPDVAYYRDFLPQPLLDELNRRAEPVAAVPGLRVAPGLLDEFPTVETAASLTFVVRLYREVVKSLDRVLAQRAVDRAFVDQTVKSLVDGNAGLPYHSPDYATVIGKRDNNGRVVVGPLSAAPAQTPVQVPAFLEGDQVTLFGPPDSEKLAINAMNAVHRRPSWEPDIVAKLVDESGQVPRWGADNEDSKTPLMRSLLAASANLKGCLDRTLTYHDEVRGKDYALADDRLSIPIKRICGLALPDGSHLLDGEPLPLHLHDFATHLFHHRDNPEALVFYVPKLENEEEAAYLQGMIATAERMVQELSPSYEIGTVKLFIVFENPRAIFRIPQMAEALTPYFVGGSLGWHDFLGSTARLFRHDPRYRIPVKADPNIVINHIRESHHILVESLTPIGGLKIGGMYGVLYEAGNAKSFEVSMVGFIKDVVTQLRRGLDGFWVAHPDFVRVGLALVAAYRRGPDALAALIAELVPSNSEREPLMAFVTAEDPPGLDKDDPLYLRGVLAADIETSDVIANDDPEEVRYNVFQALQYLADWLSGNGCVALPATMSSASGEPVFVRIMDDLATTERSRWELWAEVFHGRVSVEQFDEILAEELAFIRTGDADGKRRVQVPMEGAGARWYPVAARVLRQLVVAADPVEFATELLLPFTHEPIRDADDPWAAAIALCPDHFDNEASALPSAALAALARC